MGGYRPTPRQHRATDQVHLTARGRDMVAVRPGSGILIVPPQQRRSWVQRIDRALPERRRPLVYAGAGLLASAAVVAYWQAILGALLLVIPLLAIVLGIRTVVYRRQDRRQRDAALIARCDAALWWERETGEMVATAPDLEAWLRAEQIHLGNVRYLDNMVPSDARVVMPSSTFGHQLADAMRAADQSARVAEQIRRVMDSAPRAASIVPLLLNTEPERETVEVRNGNGDVIRVDQV